MTQCWHYVPKIPITLLAKSFADRNLSQNKSYSKKQKLKIKPNLTNFLTFELSHCNLSSLISKSLNFCQFLLIFSHFFKFLSLFLSKSGFDQSQSWASWSSKFSLIKKKNSACRRMKNVWVLSVKLTYTGSKPKQKKNLCYGNIWLKGNLKNKAIILVE